MRPLQCHRDGIAPELWASAPRLGDDVLGPGVTPYLLAAAANVARYSVLLLAAAALALLTAARVTRSSSQLSS